MTTVATLALIVKTSIAAWSLVLGFAARAAGPVQLAFIALLTPIQLVLKGIGLMPGGLFRALGVVGLLTLAFLEVTKAVTDIDLALGDLPEAIGLVIEQITAKTIGLAKLIAVQIKNAITISFVEILDGLSSLFESVNEKLNIFRGDAGRQELVESNELAKVQRLTALDDLRKKAAKEITEIKAVADRIDSDANARAGERLAKLENEVQKRTKAANEAERLAKAADEADSKTKSLLETITQPIDDLITGLIGEDIIDADGIAQAIRAAIELGQRDAKPKPPNPAEIQGYVNTIIAGFKTMENEYTNTVAIMKSLTSQFASFASTEVAEALDPNEDEDGPSANERFKTFLDQIGKLIIQKLVELAIAKTILSIAGAETGGQITGGGAAHGGQIGFDDGGTVPGGKHEAAQFRPAAVAMSDTVPAWLTPGEFVNPVRSVMKYGADLFEGLRTGALDPAALREAAGLTNRRKSVKKVRSRGYAEGGPIGTLAADGAATIQQQENNQTSRGGARAAPALMVSDDQQMDRLMAGGQRAFRNWAENNSEFFRGIVRE